VKDIAKVLASNSSVSLLDLTGASFPSFLLLFFHRSLSKLFCQILKFVRIAFIIFLQRLGLVSSSWHFYSLPSIADSDVTCDDVVMV